MMTTRAIVAIVSTALEEIAMVVVWRWLLPEFGIKLPVSVLIGVMATWAAFCVILFGITTWILKKQTAAGRPTMIGSRGRVMSPLSPEGFVRIRGELWGAASDEGNVAQGEEIEVVGENGLKLVVRKAGTNKPRR